MSNLLTGKLSPSKVGLAIAAPLAAAVFSIVVSSIAVIVSKNLQLKPLKLCGSTALKQDP